MLAVVVAEIVLSAKWNRAYFAVGVPIFQRRIERIDGLTDVSLDDLQRSAATVAAAPLVFRRFDESLIAFREKPFGGTMHYAPLMRGVIRHKHGEASVMVQGLMNWSFVVLTLVLVIALGRDFRHMVLYLVAAFAVLYLIQGVRFNRVAKALRR